MPHWRKHDLRIDIVRNIIKPFEIQFKQIKSEVEESESQFSDIWDMLYADDTEHLVGTVFIILQNYINSSISDLYPNCKKLYSYYTNDSKIQYGVNITRIQLIIAIANYYKHRDAPGELHKNTKKPLDELNIEYKIYYSDNKFSHKLGSESPVFVGFSLLSNNWVFEDLIIIVSKWRENLWLNSKYK